MERSKFFHSCFGVFQGGGCRAAALVGAYEEALDRGVQFIEVAGTSAGSIIAAFIGAGAEPRQLKGFIEELDFRRFMSPPEVTKPPNWFLLQVARRFAPLSHLFFHQGFYSSVEIEKWVESCLQELLGPHQGPVPFSCLPLPVSVVATDILSKKARVWNQKLSPNESVARAVRASCSIPIFFQPVEQQFVDGGVLSNLPAFVFDHGAAGVPLTNRILAFVLDGDVQRIEHWETKAFLSALANTVVDGAQALQMELQPYIHSISIPTGSIRATDFDKVSKSEVANLISSGREAARSFFDSELSKVRTPRLPSAVCSDREDLFNRLTLHLQQDVDEILISDFDTEFVYQIFPSLFLWRMRGARLRILVPSREKKANHGAYRRRLLEKLGAEIIEDDNVSVQGFFINASDPDRASAYVRPPSSSTIHDVEAVVYEGELHGSVIATLYEHLELKFSKNASSIRRPKMSAGSQDKLLAYLQKVPQYRKSGVTLSVESVPLQELVTLANFVHEFKYRQVSHWVPEFGKVGLELFAPAQVLLEDSATSIITPPVVEAAGDKFVLIEGSTRATYMRDQGKERLVCVVARGVQDPLPGKTSAFAHVRIIGRGVERRLRYQDFDYSLFRKIEENAHPLDSFT